MQHLHRRFGLDLWLMTHVDQDVQTVTASAGPWRALAPPGTAFSWRSSLCRRMVAGHAPPVAPDVRAEPAYAEVVGNGAGRLGAVQSYVGVPMTSRDGGLLGTLCAVSGTRQDEHLVELLEPVRLIARMLSTVLDGEQAVRARAAEAAAAYALAERDALTGLRNRRGWESALAHEDDRCQRYGSSATVLVVDLDRLEQTNDLHGHAAGDALLQRAAALLGEASRPADVVARLGGDEFGVLAVECDAVCARALQSRLRVRLRSAGLRASVGAASRRAGEQLATTWQRADEVRYRNERRRALLHGTTR